MNPHTRANYLASPPLVVAYALAGRMDIDFEQEPIGQSETGEPVYLKDIWPTPEEVQATMEACVLPEMFEKQYSSAFTSNEKWNAIEITEGDLYHWTEESTYIQRPPFLEGITAEATAPEAIARRSVPGPVRRFGDDRPYFSGRGHCQRQPCREVPGRSLGRAP